MKVGNPTEVRRLVERAQQSIAGAALELRNSVDASAYDRQHGLELLRIAWRSVSCAIACLELVEGFLPHRAPMVHGVGKRLEG